MRACERLRDLTSFHSFRRPLLEPQLQRESTIRHDHTTTILFRDCEEHILNQKTMDKEMTDR
jgi:hypothetical protein